MAVRTACHEGLGLMGRTQLGHRMAAHADAGLARLEQARRTRAVGQMAESAVLGDRQMLVDPGTLMLLMTRAAGCIARARSTRGPRVRRMAIGAGQQALAYGMMGRQIEPRGDLGMTVDTQSGPGVRPREASARDALRGAQMSRLLVMRIMAARAEQACLAMGRLGPIEMGSAPALVAFQAAGVVRETHGLRRARTLHMEPARTVASFAFAVVERRRLMAMAALAARVANPLFRTRDGLDPFVSSTVALRHETRTSGWPESQAQQKPEARQPGDDDEAHGEARALPPASLLSIRRRGIIARSCVIAQRISASRALNDAPLSSMCPRGMAPS